MPFNYHNKYSILFFFSFVFSIQAFSQQNSTVSGYVSDASSGERLAGATVYVPETGKGTSCNEYGFFSLTIPPVQTKVIFRFVGYEPFVFELKIPKDTVLNVQLKTNQYY